MPETTTEPTLSRAEEAARNQDVQRRIRQLALAEKTGKVVPVLWGREAVHGFVAALKGRFNLDANDAASQIAAVTQHEPRLIRPHFRSYQRRVLELAVCASQNRDREVEAGEMQE